jgi:signal transduction histidine kinase
MTDDPESRCEWQRRDRWYPHIHQPGAHHPARRRMFRIFTLAAFILVLLAISGIVSLATVLTARFGWHGWRGLVAVLISVTVVVLGAARAFWTMRRVASPLGAVMDAAESVADGDYAARVVERGPPPLRALARSFNTMTERLQHADRQRRDLMADLAHELRTPLSVLQGRLEGLLDGVYPLEPGQLAQLLDQTKILSRLIDDLRTLALSEAGVLALQKEPVDMTDLLRDVIESFEADATRLSVSLQLDAPSPAATLDVDHVRIKEVLANLLSNALSHTPPGGNVRLALTNAADSVSISVTDTGSGMTTDEVARIFDRFYKGRNSRGAGLGLAISRNLVRAHGGDIIATSAPGKGTTVTFTLPRNASPE